MAEEKNNVYKIQDWKALERSRLQMKLSRSLQVLLLRK